MARTQAERAADYRIRRDTLREALWLDVSRETVIASGLLTAAEWGNPTTRRRRRTPRAGTYEHLASAVIRVGSNPTLSANYCLL